MTQAISEGARVRYTGHLTASLHGKEGVVTRPGRDTGNGLCWHVRFDGEANERGAALMESNLTLIDPAQLNIGDPVAYTTCDETTGLSHHFGKHGRVIATGNGDTVLVRMDESNDQFWTFASHLTKLHVFKYEFDVGDDVEYQDSERKEVVTNGCRATVIAKVRSDDGNEHVQLRWAGDSSYSPGGKDYAYARNLQKLGTKTKQPEWIEAYNTLERYGLVTFKATKLPFKPIRIGEVYGYDMDVHGDGIHVGCQTISFDMFDKVAEAVAKAREWQAIKEPVFSNDPAAQS